MSKHKKEASFKATVELDRAIQYLKDIIASLKAGTVCVTNCEQRVTLTPENLIQLGFEATQKADRETLRLELSWRKDAAPDNDIKLSISAQAPEPDAEVTADEE